MSALYSSLYPLFELDTKSFLRELEQKLAPVEAGVGVEGPGAAYAMVWEWGNVRQTKIGPKTTLGINPDGKRVYLSIQAPHGYIRVNEPLFWAAFQQEMAKLSLSGKSAGAIRSELERCAIAVATRIRDITRERVPVDTGQLHYDIKVIGIGDPLLSEEDESGILVFAREE